MRRVVTQDSSGDAAAVHVDFDDALVVGSPGKGSSYFEAASLKSRKSSEGPATAPPLPALTIDAERPPLPSCPPPPPSPPSSPSQPPPPPDDVTSEPFKKLSNSNEPSELLPNDF